uniref:O-linked N-acetylglucosamine transferase, SPINDLY family protein n=1 Tax=Anaerovibrio sp. TaxID=1872532 RepID=UPI0025EADB63
MAVMTKECWAMYKEALGFWKSARFLEAENIVEKLLAADGSEVSKVHLLSAYIKRSSGDTIGEIAILNRLVEEGCQDEPDLLGDVYSMLGQAYSIIGEPDKAVESFLQAVNAEDSLKNKLVEYSNAIFAAASLSGTDGDFWRLLYKGYEDLLYSGGLVPYADKPWQHERLRVGYLSSDFLRHPVGALLWPLITRADKNSFQLFCYAGNAESDKLTAALRKHADVWRQVKDWSFKSIAKQIYIDEIDILVDLGGHTKGNMLPVLAWRPAKLQISAIGWVGSTGMSAVDYVLGDEFCTPFTRQSAYVEKLLKIRGSHFCFHPYRTMPEVSESPYKHNGYITFGCFNNFSKVTDDMLVLWSRLLAGVPNSKLFLKHKLFDSAEGIKYTEERLERCGIPADRLILRGFSEDYLEQYADMDIALDTFPYTGGMTTFEALYMGVPVVSMYGESRGQRFGYSMLMNAGLGDMAAQDSEEYVDIATALGNNPELLLDLRTHLRDIIKASPLMDEAG